jgi:hypothetical protein
MWRANRRTRRGCLLSIRPHTSSIRQAYVRIRQAYVRIRQAYVRIRPHTSSIRYVASEPTSTSCMPAQHTSAYVKHTSAYVKNTSAYVKHTSAYVKHQVCGDACSISARCRLYEGTIKALSRRIPLPKPYTLNLCLTKPYANRLTTPYLHRIPACTTRRSAASREVEAT